MGGQHCIVAFVRCPTERDVIELYMGSAAFLAIIWLDAFVWLERYQFQVRHVLNLIVVALVIIEPCVPVAYALIDVRCVEL